MSKIRMQFLNTVLSMNKAKFWMLERDISPPVQIDGHLFGGGG